MAEVLYAPGGSTPFGSGQLRRSASSNSFSSFVDSPTTFKSSKPYFSHKEYEDRIASSMPSSGPSSPEYASDISSEPSFMSTPLSNFSTDTQSESSKNDAKYPTYDDDGYFGPLDNVTHPSPLADVDAPTSTPNATPPRRDSERIPLTVGDDTAIETEPSRHVDYLSHEWREEDIWSSWRHVVARRGVYGNSSRLENASWRTWAKAKWQLQTVQPESLNW